MSRSLRLSGLSFIIIGLLASVSRGQQDKTAEDCKLLKDKFQIERDQAVKAKFTPTAYARAEELAQRGDAAMKTGNFKAAARYYRDARWQLPYLPAELPEHVVRVLGESRIRHADRVNALAYNSEGTRLASCSRDGTVKIWDLANGRDVCTYRGHGDQVDDPTKNSSNKLVVSDVAFHPKKKQVASASGNQVHLWDPETGKLIKIIVNLGKTDKPIKPIAFSPDGTHLAVGADDGILRIVELDTGKITYTSPARNARIEALAYSPNGNMIAVGDNNSHVAIYAPAQPNPLVMSIEGIDLGEVTNVAFTSDSGGVFACGRDPKIRLIAGPKPDGTNAPNTSVRLRDYVGHNGPVKALAATADGAFLITGGDDSTVRVWEVATAKQIRVFQGHQKRDPNDTSGKGITALAVSKDGKQIASGSDDGAMRLWDLNTTDEHQAFRDAGDSLWSVAYSPDGKRLAAAGSDKMIRIYNMETGKLEVSLPGAKSPITSLAFFPDSNRLAAGGGDRVVVVWDIAKNKAIAELSGHESAILSLAVSDDGKRVVSGSADRTIRIFSPEADKPLWTWTARSIVCAVAIRKGNKELAAGLADGSMTMLDISGPAPREISSQSVHVSGILCVAFSPDGERLASVGGDGILRVWTVGDNGTLSVLVRFEGQPKPGSSSAFSPLTGVAFSRDSRYVAAVGADTIVRIWDLEAKSESRSLRGHVDWVTSVAFSPDGRFIASVGVEKDKAVRVFELPPLDSASSGGHMLAVNAVAVSPNGKLAVTAGTDQTIKLWDIAAGKEIATLIENSDTPYAIAFLGDDDFVMGGKLASGHTGRLHLWTTKPNRLAKTITTGQVFNLVANAGGSKFAAWAARPASSGGDLKNHMFEIYDKEGKELSTLTDAGRDIKAVTFSNDLEWAIAGDEKGNVGIWDLAKRKRIGDESLWPLFTSPLRDIGITPNKKYLVAADERGSVKVAEIAKREVIASFAPHKAKVWSITMSPTGTSFATVSEDREVKSWSLDSGNLKEPKATRTWVLPVSINSVTYTPDGKQLVTANADGTSYVLELP